jgi:hypothetical protein
LGAFFFSWRGAVFEYWAETPMMSRTSLLDMAETAADGESTLSKSKFDP